MDLASTVLPQRAEPVEIQKMGLDLLAKIRALAGIIPGASSSGIKSVSGNYAVTPDDGVADLFVTTGASTVTVTLARSATVAGRVLRVWKADGGAGEVQVVGNTTGGVTETISGYSAVYVGYQFQHADIYQDGSTNFNIGQYIQPVSGEPSLGTPHKHVVTILNTDPSSTSVQTLDISSYVPVGTTWIEGYWFILSATADRRLRLCNSDDTETYLYITNPVAGQYGRGLFSCPVVDRKIYWAVNNADVSSIGLQMNRYWC